MVFNLAVKLNPIDDQRLDSKIIQLKAVTVLIQVKWERRGYETYFEAFNELRPLNISILVDIEGIEDDTELLSGEEDAKF